MIDWQFAVPGLRLFVRPGPCRFVGDCSFTVSIHCCALDKLTKLVSMVDLMAIMYTY